MFRKVFLAACLLCFGALEASAQQSYAAQDRPVRAPRIPVEPARPGDFKVSNLRPDLVVKEMRLEGDKAVHMLVANNGTANAGKFNVLLELYGNKPGPEITELETVYELKAGEEKWLTFKSPFVFLHMSPPGRSEYHLADMKSFIALVDVPSSGDAFQSMFKDKTTPPNGDVIESDESNNSRRIQKSDMAPWPPPL